MKSLWSDQKAHELAGDDLALRVYSSNLLGQEPKLVLHGGGNTSVKLAFQNIFGELIDTLYVKGSGRDLRTIDKTGFAPIVMKDALRLAAFDVLSDIDMVAQLRLAQLDTISPDASIEALVHAVIPAKYVDHTHSNAILILTNSREGKEQLKSLFPDFLILPYMMPGFALAKQIQQAISSGMLANKKGIILKNHGIFTFGDSAKESYERMIEAVSHGEAAIHSFEGAAEEEIIPTSPNLLKLARIRQIVSQLEEAAVVVNLDQSDNALRMSCRSDAGDILSRGPLTPDHTILTKMTPVVLSDDFKTELENYKSNYLAYFDAHSSSSHVCLKPAPKWAIWKDIGLLSFDRNQKQAKKISDIASHTIDAIMTAEELGGWQPLNPQDLFDIEYWALEQRKLNNSGNPPELQGRIAIVTGGAAGIGRQCAAELMAQGVCVVGLDVLDEVMEMNGPNYMGLFCDVSDEKQIQNAVEQTVKKFGGLDILICNAGIFTAGEYVENLDQDKWDKTLLINLTANQILLRHAIPYLKCGFKSAVIFVGSRNVNAPGPGASAYSVSKAGLTQLARVLAMELAPDGIRVNVVHPDAVFDTELWTEELLKSSAERYKMTVDEYKTRNLLSVEISSKNVAKMCVALSSDLFSVTTGAQIPMDGGNDRVI